MLSYIHKIKDGAQDRGASAVEYALMVAAIAAVIVAVVFGLGGLVRDTFDNTCDQVSSTVGADGGVTAGTGGC